MNETQILDAIKNEEIKGFIRCDLICPSWLKEKTENFPLIYKKILVGREDVGPIMKEYLKKTNLLKTPNLQLIGSHYAKQILIATNLAKFYMSMGVEIKNIERVIEYQYTNALIPFVQKAAKLRYSAKNHKEKLLSNLAKSLIVSCYGKFNMNVKKYSKVRFVTSNYLLKFLYLRDFISCDFVAALSENDELYEVRYRPNIVHLNSPVHLASQILNTSKLLILQLVYDIIYNHFDPRTYAWFGFMTDSVSIICSAKNFNEWIKTCIIPGKEESFEKLRKDFLFLPNDEETIERNKYSAGLFREEWTGTAAIGVAAKAYCIAKGNQIVKMSARGLPYNAAKNVSLNEFHDILLKHKPLIVEVESFQYIQGRMLSEKLKKYAVSPIYTKRILYSDMTTGTLKL